MVKYVGILNVTPDSFSDGGKYEAVDDALVQASSLFDAGASVVDVGGQSTRPGADEITWQEEWSRVEPVLRAMKQESEGGAEERSKLLNSAPFPLCSFSQISLDTKHPQTAEKFVDMGGRILNDVSGFQDPQMQEIACKYEMIIVNHFPGKTIDEVHEQKIDSIDRVVDDLLKTKEKLLQFGVDEDSIVLDPGIGFGKTMECNWRLLEFARFVPGERVLIGASRKRFLEAPELPSFQASELSDQDLEDLEKGRFSREANAVVERIVVESGAEFLRVHEIRI